MLPKMRRQFLIAVVAVCAIYAYVFTMFRADVRAGKPDFVIFHTAGAMARTGQGQYLYDVPHQHAVQRSIVGEVPERAVPLLFNHAPFEAILFAPISGLRFEHAYLAWYIVNISLVLLFSWLAVTRLPSLSKYTAAAGIASAVFYGTLMTMVQGQDSGLLLCLLTGFFLALLTKNDSGAGALLAFATIKPHLVLPELLLLLVLRRWRALLSFVGELAILLFLSGLVLGFSTVASYPAFLLDFGKGGAAAQLGVYPQVMASLRGLLLMSGVNARLTSMMVIGSLILSAFGLFVLAQRARSDQSLRLLAGAVVCGSIFFSVHVNPHDLILLLFPIAVALSESRSEALSRRTRLALIAVSAAVYLSPLLYLNFQLMAVLILALGVTLAYGAVSTAPTTLSTPAAAER